MKKSRFTDSQIIAVLKQAQAGTPAPKLQQQLEQLSRLPKAQQRLVSQLIDTVLQQHGG